MGQVVNAWIEYAYSFEVFYVAGPDTNQQPLLDKLNQSVMNGKSPEPEMGDVEYPILDGTFAKGYTINTGTPQEPFYTFVRTGTEYLLLKRTVVDVISDPNFSPSPLDGGTISKTLTSDTPPTDITVTSLAYSWSRNFAYITDQDGDGRDDHGRMEGAGALDLKPLTTVLSPESMPTASDYAEIFAETMALAARNSGDLNLEQTFKILSRSAMIAGQLLSTLEATDRINHASNPYRQAFIEAGDVTVKFLTGIAGEAVLPGPGGPVSVAIYTLTYEDDVRDWLGRFYDQQSAHNADPSAANAGLAPAAYPAAPTGQIAFDRVYYLANNADARAALLNGTASSAYAHYMTVGLANGYHPNAQTGAVDPNDVALRLIGNDPAAGFHTDVRSAAFGTYAGDGANGLETGFTVLANAQRPGGAPLANSANLFALANRLAIDISDNRDAAPQLHAGDGSTFADLTFGNGQSARALFPAVDLTHTAIYVVATDGANPQAALAAFSAQSGTAADLTSTGAHAIGVAEYGGVWVLLVDHASGSFNAPAAETPFTLVHYGTDDADHLVAGQHPARLEGMGGDDTLIGGPGNDVLHGGDGDDTAVFSGTHGDYAIAFDAATGTFTVSDQRGGAPDGSDTLAGVEIFRFSDGTLTYDAAGQQIEQHIGAVLIKSDPQNLAPWTSQTWNFDAQGSLTQQTIVNDNGTHWTNQYDDAAAQSWAWRSDAYDAQNHLLSETGTNDDGSHWLALYDAANAYGWANVTLNFDAQWNQTGLSGTRDNGGHTVAMSEVSAALDIALWFATPYDADFAAAPADRTLTGGTASDALYGGTGNDTISGGAGNDILAGGSGNNTLTGGAGADLLIGGSGSDTFVYGSVSESGAALYDTVMGFDATADVFQLPVEVLGIATALTGGSLSAASFDADLTAALNSGHLSAYQAVLFTPNAGTLAGQTFLVIDANGQNGYQAGQELVIHLTAAANLAALSINDFI